MILTYQHVMLKYHILYIKYKVVVSSYNEDQPHKGAEAFHRSIFDSCFDKQVENFIPPKVQALVKTTLLRF